MYCPNCGSQLPDGSLACASCGWREVIQQALPLADDPAMRMLLPVGRSGLAIVAGYLGLFSLIVFPAPFALLFGILALLDIKKHPEKGGKGRAIFGIVMGSIFMAIPLFAILAAIATGG